MVVVEREKCIGCGLCVKDCPAGKLKLEEKKAVYTPECIQCGHCIAVCPQAAVSIPEYDMGDVEEFDKETFAVDPEHFLRAVKFRRSVRSYREKPVEREKLERILQAGRYTPTAKNSQSCRFIVLQDELDEFKRLLWEEIPKLAEQMKKEMPQYAMLFKFMYRRWKKDPEDDQLFFNAPSCILIASENPLDGGLAAANMETMVVAEGAGVLYSGYLQRIIEASSTLKEWLQIEERHLTCCMLVGYPAVTYKRTAPRKKADIIWR
ncbi:nitroreductase family protein [Mediterraneibacter glycyrrhizinilyticus]|uniref:nitroreductase family protein n=1 Tax=Mediterraneibacter glycyrrhizinilyticus TaxID=342942 RepID=UPI0025AAE123|nr:nitroreductase family protein [Mediterraneibacter glycyrrhizinilyticus]MDN0059850.1 nitroreductase family protein [Mediterraneibacter glycyrrhizinilyticus]